MNSLYIAPKFGLPINSLSPTRAADAVSDHRATAIANNKLVTDTLKLADRRFEYFPMCLIFRLILSSVTTTQQPKP